MMLLAASFRHQSQVLPKNLAAQVALECFPSVLGVHPFVYFSLSGDDENLLVPLVSGGSFFIQLGNEESASLVPNKDFYYH